MINLFFPPKSIGLELTPTEVKTACVTSGKDNPTILSLSIFPHHSEHVKQLYIDHPIISTAVRGKDVLIRSLTLPLTKLKDINDALSFQAEPLLPYSIDQACLAYQITSKSTETTELAFLSIQKETLLEHLEVWRNEGIEPEVVGSVPSALCAFASCYLSSIKTVLILHIGTQEITCSLINEGKLWASFTQPDGFELLVKAQQEDGGGPLPQGEEEWKTIKETAGSALGAALKKIEKEIAKMCFSLSKESGNTPIEGVALTGEVALCDGLSETLVKHLSYPLKSCASLDNHTSRELHYYAVPLGLAIGALPGSNLTINFRQHELSYPHPWRRLQLPLALLLTSIFLLTLAFYFFSQQYIDYQEGKVKQEYIDLLGSLNKTHENFEKAFLAKNPYAEAPDNDEIPKVEQLDREDIARRLTFLQKEFLSTPDSFPLFANTPRVSDVFAWLTQHPAVLLIDEEGNKQSKLQIENFSYSMVKRPQQGKKQEKYQVKIEIEFTSPTPKLAREFHDALITPNEWIDPKGEVKWNSSRGKYKTSFFLKDKTAYPSF